MNSFKNNKNNHCFPQCNNFMNCIVESIRSISQESKFYRRAVSKFLYTICNQCGIFYSLSQEYELKILRVSVKLPTWVFTLQKNMQGAGLTRLTVLWKLQHFNVFFNFRAEAAKMIDYIEKCFKRKLYRIRWSAKNSAEVDLHLPLGRS